MPSIATPRLTVAYRTHGDPNGLPVVFVHGSHASSRWWQPLFAELPDVIYAVAPDLRGCGSSERSEEGYEIADQADDLWSFLIALNLRPVDLVGHSTGAALVIELALQHPEAAESLVLVSPAPVEGIHTPVELLALLEQMKEDAELHRAAIEAVMPTAVSDEQLRFVETLVADARQMAPAAFTALAEALGRWNRFAEAQRLTLPTLIVWGDRDEIVDRDAVTRTLLAIPGAHHLEVLHGVGHSPLIEAPALLADRLLDFLAEDNSRFAAVRGSAFDA